MASRSPSGAGAQISSRQLYGGRRGDAGDLPSLLTASALAQVPLLQAGTKVWVLNPAMPRPRGPGAEPDDEDTDPTGRSGAPSSSVYVLGAVESRIGAETFAVRLEQSAGSPGLPRGAVVTRTGALQVHANDLFLAAPGGEDTPSNLVDLPHVHEAAVVHAIAARFARGAAATWVGDTLAVVNAGRGGAEASSTEAMMVARWRAVRRSSAVAASLGALAVADASAPRTAAMADKPAEKSAEGSDPDASVPSVFEAAEEAVWRAVGEGVPQAVLVLGEAGSGKSAASSLVVRYLAASDRIAAEVESASLAAAEDVLAGLRAAGASIGAMPATVLVGRSTGARRSSVASSAAGAAPATPGDKPPLQVTSAGASAAAGLSARAQDGSACEPGSSHAKAVDSARQRAVTHAAEAFSAVMAQRPRTPVKALAPSSTVPASPHARTGVLPSAARIEVILAEATRARMRESASVFQLPLLARRLEAAHTVLASLTRAETAVSSDASRCGVLSRVFLAASPAGVAACPSDLAPGILETAAAPGTAVAARVDITPVDLERVSHTPPGERNFHVFYQLCAGLPAAEAARLSVPEAQHCRVLHRGGVTERGAASPAASGPASDAESDAAAFARFNAALELLGVGLGQQAQVHQVLAAVIALGDVQLVPRPEGDEAGEHAMAQVPPATAAKLQACVVAGSLDGIGSDATCVLVPPDDIAAGAADSETAMRRLNEAQWAGRRFEEAADLLGVPRGQLAALLTRRSLARPTGAGGARWTAVSVAHAEARRDRLMRALYAALVDTAVAWANTSLGGDHPAVGLASSSLAADISGGLGGGLADALSKAAAKHALADAEPVAGRGADVDPAEAEAVRILRRILSSGATAMGPRAESVPGANDKAAAAASRLVAVGVLDLPGYATRPVRSDFNPPPDAAFDPTSVAAGGGSGLGRNGLWQLLSNFGAEQAEGAFATSRIVSRADMLGDEGLLRQRRPAPTALSIAGGRGGPAAASRRNPADHGRSGSADENNFGLEDNQPVLSLLAAPSIGMLGILQEAMHYSASTDADVLKKAATMHKRSRCLNRLAKPVERVAAATLAEEYMTAEDAVVAMHGSAAVGVPPDTDSEAAAQERRSRAHAVVVRQMQHLFAVRHTQGHTPYDALGMLDANRAATAPLSICGAVMASSCPLVAMLARVMRAQALRGCAADAEDAGASIGRARTATSSQRHGAAAAAGPAASRASAAPSVYDSLRVVEERREADAAVEGAQAPRAADVVAKLTSLLESVSGLAADPLFVRCLLPAYGAPDGASAAAAAARGPSSASVCTKALAHQVRSQALVPALRAATEGFSLHALFADFYDVYVMVLPRASSGHLPLACPRHATAAEARSLCEGLLDALWAQYASALDGLDRSRQVQLGRTRIFLRREVAAALETLRSVRRTVMDRAAVRVQAFMRGLFYQNKFLVARQGAARLQAVMRARPARSQFARARAAAICIATAFRGFAARQRFLSAKRALTKLKACWAARKAQLAYRRSLRTLQRLQAVAAGALLRKQLLDRYEAAVTIQRATRSFVRQNRRFWGEVHASLLLQACWRGFQWRRDNRNVVLFVRKRVVARVAVLRLARLQAQARCIGVRTAFVELRASAVKVQRWLRAMLLWRGLSVMRQAATSVQRMMRHAVFRQRLRGSRERRLLAEHSWKTMQARERETDQLVHHLHRVARINAAKHRRLRERLSESRRAEAVRDKWGFAFAGFGRVADGMPERDREHVAHEHYVARDSLVIDVDAVTSVDHSYPEGWTKGLSDLDAALRERGQTVTTVALGSHHTVVLSSEGHVYSWGMNDRHQLGQGYVRTRVVMTPAEAKRVRQAQAFRNTSTTSSARHGLGKSRRSRSAERSGLQRRGYHESTSSRAAAVAMTVGVPLEDIYEEDAAGVPLHQRGDITKPLGGAIKGNDALAQKARLIRRMSAARLSPGMAIQNSPVGGMAPASSFRFSPEATGESPPPGAGGGSVLHRSGSAIQTMRRRPSALNFSARDGFTRKSAPGTSPVSSAQFSAARSPRVGVVTPGTPGSPPPALMRATSAGSVVSNRSRSVSPRARSRRDSRAVTTRTPKHMQTGAGSLVLGRSGSLRMMAMGVRVSDSGTVRGGRVGDDGSSVGTDYASVVNDGEEVFARGGGRSGGMGPKRPSRVWAVGGTTGSPRVGGGGGGGGVSVRGGSFRRTGTFLLDPAAESECEPEERPSTILDTRVVTTRRLPSGAQTPTIVSALRFEPGEQRRPLRYLTEGIKVIAIAAGADHTLALTESGRVMSWGSNARGQLGLTHREPTAEPSEVPNLRGRRVVQIAAGPRHSLAVTHSGAVYSWGAGEFTGHGSAALLDPKERFSEASVASATNAALARGETMDDVDNPHHPLFSPVARGFKGAASEAVVDGGSAKFVPGGHRMGLWGAKSGRRSGTAASVTTAGDTGGPSTASDREDRAAARAERKLRQWRAPDRLEPAPVRSLGRHHIKSVVTGWGFTMALTLQGRVLGWGDNSNGQLGIGTPHADMADGCAEFEPLPVAVWPPATLEAGEEPIVHDSDEAELVTGADTPNLGNTLGSTRSGGSEAVRLSTKAELLAASERDADGRSVGGASAKLRSPSTVRERRVYFDMPVAMPSREQRARKRAADEEERAGREAQQRRQERRESASSVGGSAGAGAGAGADHRRGETKRPEDKADEDVTASLLDRDLPLPAGAEEADFAGAAKAVVAGGSHVMVLTNMGGVWSWGSNAFGQLGLGHFEDQHRPRLVRALAGVGVGSIAAGWRHSIAVVDGGIVAWGHTSAVPTVTPIPMPPPPPGVREAGADAGGEEWAGSRPAHGRLDLTHAVSPLPLESPFRTTHRTALAALCAFSHTLSISVVAYTELLLGHDPRRPPVTAVERSQGRLQLWKRHEREVHGSGAGHSRGLAALAAIAATVEAELDANGGLDADGEDSDEAASVPDELRDDAYVTGARRLPVAGYVDSYVTRVRASLPVTAAQAAAAAEAGTDVHAVSRRKSRTSTSMARIAATTGPASMDVSGRAAAGASSTTAASKRSDVARRTMGQRRPTLSFLSPAAATPLGLASSGPARPKARLATAGTAGAGPLGAAPPPPPRRAGEAGAGGMFAHRPTEAVRSGLEAAHGGTAGAQRSEADAERARQAHREDTIAAINAAAVSADAEREVIDAVSSIPGLAHQVAGPISGRWLAAGLMKYMGRHAGQDKARRARESGRARKEARAVTLPGLLHAAAIAHAANVARRAVARGLSDEAAAQEAARALAAGAASAKRAAEFNASFRAAVAQAVGGRAGDEVSETASRWLGVGPSAGVPARSRRGTRAPASLGAAVVAAAAGSSPTSSEGREWRRGAAAQFDGDGEESVRDEYDADGRLAMARHAADAEGMQGHGGSILTLMAIVRRRQLEAAAAAVAARSAPGVRSLAAEAAAAGHRGSSAPARGLDSTTALLEVQAAVAGGDVGALVAAGIDPASAAAASAELVQRLRRGESGSHESAVVPSRRRSVTSTQIASRGLVLSARAVSNLLLQLRLRRAKDLTADTTPLERLSLLPALALEASRVAELAIRRDRSLGRMSQEELQARLAETRAIEEAGVADVAGADARAAASLRAAALRHIARHPADVARVEADEPTSHAAIVARAQGAGRRWREPGMSVAELGGGGDLLAIAWGGADLAARTGRRATRSEAAVAAAVAVAARGGNVALGGAALDPLMQVSSTGFGRMGFDRHGRRVDAEAEARNVVLWRQREQADATDRARRRISLQREVQRQARLTARASGGPMGLGTGLKRFDPSQFPLPASWLGNHGGGEHGGAAAERGGAGRFDPGRGHGVRPMDASLDARAFAVAEQPMTEAERKTAWQNKARLAASSTAAPIAGESLSLGEAPAPSWAGHAARAIHRSAAANGGSPAPQSRSYSSQPRFSGMGTTDVDAAIDHEIAAQSAAEGQLGAAMSRGGVRASRGAAAGDESARSRDALSSAIRSAADQHWRRGGRDSVAGDAATAATGVTVGRSTVAGPPGVPMGDLMPTPRELRRSSQQQQQQQQQPQQQQQTGRGRGRGNGDGDDEPVARHSPPPGLAYDPQDLELEDEIGVSHAR